MSTTTGREKCSPCNSPVGMWDAHTKKNRHRREMRYIVIVSGSRAEMWIKLPELACCSLHPTQCLHYKQLVGGEMWLTSACGQIVCKLLLFFFFKEMRGSPLTGKIDCLQKPKVTSGYLLLENISFFFLTSFVPYIKPSLLKTLRLVAIVMEGSGKTQLNDEIINKWTKQVSCVELACAHAQRSTLITSCL